MRAPLDSSSGVTSHGPTGVEASQTFPWSHSEVRPWKPRIETSSATANPAMCARASSTAMRRPGSPITMHSSPS